MNLKQKVGKQIRMIRKNRHLTQAELATLIRVDPKSISKIEKGYIYPSAETIDKLSQELDVCVYEFFLFDDIKPVALMKSDIISSISDEHKILMFMYHVLRCIKEFQ